MAEYIEREALLSDEEEPLIWFDEDAEIAIHNEWCHWVEKIKSIPAADVVSVVRCKDCKHSHEPDSDGWFLCDYHAMYMESIDDFCSHGKRRAGGEIC